MGWFDKYCEKCGVKVDKACVWWLKLLGLLGGGRDARERG